MELSRTKNSLRNIIVAFASNIFITFLTFFTSRVIKDKLGLEVLGLNGVFSNIISILSLTELGIGGAITFALYKPIAEKNTELIKSIMKFYKKAYQIVAIAVALLGFLILPFIKLFVKSNFYSQEYISVVYLLFLLNSVISYLFVYKRTLIIADQKNFIITTITLIYTYVLKILQLVVVYFTSNYMLYLIVNIICTCIYNIVISLFCNHLYPFLKDKIIKKIPHDLYKEIINKVKALFLSSIGTIIVYSTDNILISYFCGIEDAGRYTSYLAIINMIGSFISIIFDNVRDSIGNFLVSESKERQYELYQKLFYINQTIVNICSVCLITLITPFISLWLGEDAIIGFPIVFLMVFNFNVTKNTLATGTIKTAAGLFEPLKFGSIIESIINLVMSVVLAKKFGLIGIVLGTSISYVCVSFWCGAYVVHHYVLHKKFILYLKEYFKYTLSFVVICIIIVLFSYYVIDINNCNIFIFIIKSVIIFSLTCLLWIIIFFRTPQQKVFLKTLKNKIIKK